MSDIHLEMMTRRQVREFIDRLRPAADVDVLVLPGDVLPGTDVATMADVLTAFGARYPRVVYVPGNHEYYKTSPREFQTRLQWAAMRQDHWLTILRAGQAVEIDGRRFIGDTMWFPLMLDHGVYAGALADYSAIEDFEPWVYEENRKTVTALEMDLRRGDIVVTHHLPTPKSIAPQFLYSRLNRFFLCDCTKLIQDRQPALWLHGHTHVACDYHVGDTRIVCNPFGYPSETASETGFRSDLVVEI